MLENLENRVRSRYLRVLGSQGRLGRLLEGVLSETTAGENSIACTRATVAKKT